MSTVDEDDWIHTQEGQAWLKEWNDNKEVREAETRRLLQGPMQSTSDWLKEVYPDVGPPAPLKKEAP